MQLYGYFTHTHTHTHKTEGKFHGTFTTEMQSAFYITFVLFHLKKSNLNWLSIFIYGHAYVLMLVSQIIPPSPSSHWVQKSVLYNSLQPYGLKTLPGSSVHGILQARTLEWVAMPSSRGSSPLRDQTHVSFISCIGRWVLYPQFHLGSTNIPHYTFTVLYKSHIMYLPSVS